MKPKFVRGNSLYTSLNMSHCSFLLQLLAYVILGFLDFRGFHSCLAVEAGKKDQGKTKVNTC